MPKFVMNRDLNLVSLQGAAIEFKKGVPTFAPEFLRKEIIEKGGDEVADDGAAVGGEPVQTGNDRQAAIVAAFDKYALSAADANKVPTIKELHDAGAPTLTAEERDAAWAAYKAGK